MRTKLQIQNDEMTRASADGRFPAKRQLTGVEIGQEATAWLPAVSISVEDLQTVYGGALGAVGSLQGSEIELVIKKIAAGAQPGTFRVEGRIVAVNGKPLGASK